jgi:hypothetical protein
VSKYSKEEHILQAFFTNKNGMKTIFSNPHSQTKVMANSQIWELEKHEVVTTESSFWAIMSYEASLIRNNHKRAMNFDTVILKYHTNQSVEHSYCEQALPNSTEFTKISKHSKPNRRDRAARHATPRPLRASLALLPSFQTAWIDLTAMPILGLELGLRSRPVHMCPSQPIGQESPA